MALDQAKIGLKVTGHPDMDTRREDSRSKFEIPADAQARRQQRIRFLRSGEEQHKRLGDKLVSCEKSHRCKSEADPVCAALFWQKLCRDLRGIVAGRSWTRAFVVTPGLLVPYGHLGEFDPRAAVERVREQLERSSLRDHIIIGAIDISLVLKNKTIIGWQLYLNLLIEGKNRGRLQEAVEAVFPPEPTAPKPYVFKDVTDPEMALAHIYKYKFFRKSWYRVKKKVGTAKLPLTRGDLQELLSFLGRYPIGTRLLLSGPRKG